MDSTWEERLFCDDEMRAEIDEEMEAIFWMDQLASFDFDSDCEKSEDPLATDSESDGTVQITANLTNSECVACEKIREYLH